MSKAAHAKSNQPVSKKKRAIIIGASIAAAALILIALVQLVDRYITTTGESDLPSVESVVTIDANEPDESRPDVGRYNVPADQPRSITLSTIGASGIIQKVGLNSKNAISVPTNIHFAGWYTGSAKPGDLGLSIIDGHVLGRYKDGVFKDLKRLKPGDAFEVEYGDKSIREFRVVDVRTLPEKDTADYLLLKREDIDRQLNLVTCGGKFNRATQTFDERVVVISRLE